VQTGTAAKREYGSAFLAAALMLCCRMSSIPIPKRAKKSVELDD
jgi:hypothetical protein